MSETVISVENLYKEYKLGIISHGTLYRDMQSWWARVRKKEDPNSLISEHHSIKTDSDSFLALNDISFDVKAGDRVGIIGKNGAGKSTLLKILSRITSPTSGQIKVKGRIGSLLEVGTGFHQELTGRENIYLNGAILGMRKWEIDKKLEEIIDFAGIEKHIDTPVKRYSSGMNVRLGFAVAAHLDPEILVVDEVLAVGDAEFQRKALGKMENISKNDGRTILFVSHNMDSIITLCDRVICLDQGEIIDDNNSESVIKRYIESTVSFLDKDNKIEDIDRSRGKEKAIIEAWIENSKNKKTNILFMGEKVKVKFSYDIHSRIKTPNFGFRITNTYGQNLFSLNSNISSKEKNESKMGIAVFDIQDLILLPGKYYITLSVVDGETEWIDYLENVLSFSVSSSDIYGTGKLISHTQGLVAIRGAVYIEH